MTCLLLIRHGLAEPFVSAGSDAERALTTEGWLLTRQAMAGLVARGFLPNRGISSPYRRAMESMACLKEAAGNGFPVGIFEGLEPEADVIEAEAWLRRLMLGAGEEEILAFTSHQPFLGDLVHRLTGRTVEVKNACCTVVEWVGNGWTFKTHFSPDQLREGLR